MTPTDDVAEDLRLLADSIRDYAIIITDPSGQVTRWSAGAESIMGWTADEAAAHETADFIFTPEDRAAGAPEQERQTALRDGRAEDERWHLKKGGDRFWASGVMTPLYDPATGSLRGFGKVLRDLTERKRLEDDLLRANNALRLANEDAEARVAARTTELRDLSRRALTRVEDERRRVSRELHDQTGQSLAALALELSRIEASAELTRDAAREAALAAREAAREARTASDTAEEAARAAVEAAHGPDAAVAARLAQTTSDAARSAAIAGTDARAAAAAADAAMGAVDDAAPRVARLRTLAESLSRDVHRIAVDLRPTALDDLGLAAAIRGCADQCVRRSGLTVDVAFVNIDESGDPDRRLPPDVETALYRIVQEALTNVTKHATGDTPGDGATRVAVTLQRAGSQAVAVVEDDGPGFDPDAVGADRLGLAGMRERAALLGGTLEIESTPGTGTTVFARLPVGPGGVGE